MSQPGRVVTEAGSPGSPSGPGFGRVLCDRDIQAAVAICQRDPVASVLARVRLEHARIMGIARCGGQFWGYQVGETLVAVCWSGVNLVPVLPPITDQPMGVGVDPVELGQYALRTFGAFGRAQGRRCSSIVGEATATLGLWDQLRPAWGQAREVRAAQPSMVIDHDPLVRADPAVRLSCTEDFHAVMPACAEMFTEEVGYSPLAGSGGAYESRVRGLIRDRRSFIRVDPPDQVRPGRNPVVFKAELGAVAGGVAQVQGVWVRPDRRGERLSAGGMAAVVTAARRAVAPVVSLYVNGYNVRALATYRRVGFRQVGTYATVLF